jgi:SAM-dependent methyltransferase
MATSTSGRNGVLLQAPGSRHDDQIFFCRDGRRHWIMNTAWLADNGYVWPDDVQIVSPAVIDAFAPGRWVAMPWTDADRASPPLHSTVIMREIAVARLSGTGIEVGAGATPMPVPLDCTVRYVDMFTIDELRKHAYEGQHPSDMVIPDIVASFDDMSPILDGSVDFVVACHVIEHVNDPIAALENNWMKLRPGGKLALVVPDMRRTFDRDRELTSIAHLIEDNERPDERRERDKMHFQEFYRTALPVPESVYETTWRGQWETAFPIHYHTWTYESFSGLIAMLTAPGGRLANASVWSQPAIPHPNCNEFWFVLTKSKSG